MLNRRWNTPPCRNMYVASCQTQNWCSTSDGTRPRYSSRDGANEVVMNAATFAAISTLRVVESGPAPKESVEEERRISSPKESYHLGSNFRTCEPPISTARPRDRSRTIVVAKHSTNVARRPRASRCRRRGSYVLSGRRKKGPRRASGKGQRRMDERLCFCRLVRLRRTPMRKSLATSQLTLHQLVQRFPVDRRTGEPPHCRLHDPADVLGRCRADLADCVVDGLFDGRRIGRRR